jgi:hypothetical protein
VAYADDGEQPQATTDSVELRAKFAEFLLRVTTPPLARILTSQKALLELREYATMLLNEVEYTYTADRKAAGVTEAELQGRLQENVDCARRLYAQRVTTESSATNLLDERIAEIVETRGSEPFGRDLAEVMRRTQAPAAAAEAS